MRLLERFFNAEASFTGFVLAEAMCTSLDSGAVSTAEVVSLSVFIEAVSIPLFKLSTVFSIAAQA